MKHCWNVSTSPRSPAKIRPELQALAEFDGSVNDANFQEKFTRVLTGLKGFEGQGSEDNETFSARDRIAPMQTYGFVHIDNQTKVIRVTPAGRALIDANAESARQEIWLRQLLKWQFPSPQHCNAQYTIDQGLFGRSGFSVRPFVAGLDMISRCDGLTKAEIAMFLLTTRTMDRISEWCKAIFAYRRIRESLPGSYRKKFTDSAIKLIYDERNREFMPSRTVGAASAKDYADAAFRLFRMTGLVTAKGSRIIVAPERATDVAAILATKWPMRDDWDDEAAFYSYFGAADAPKLPWEDTDALRKRTLGLKRRVGAILESATFLVPTVAASLIPTDQQIDMATRTTLLHQYDDLLAAFKELQRTSMIAEIRTSAGMLAVSAFFDNILKKVDIFDAPLQLEWNCWRALLSLDHTDLVEGNFTLDNNLQPFSRAPGGGPDGYARFPAFDVIFEPTLKTGPKQWNDEWEPIYRHAVLYTNKLRTQGDERQVFTLAIAPKIEDSLAASFLNTAKGLLNIPAMREAPLIVPVTVAQLQELLAVAAQVDGFSPDEIWLIFELIRDGIEPLTLGDHAAYLMLIKRSIEEVERMVLADRGGAQAA